MLCITGAGSFIGGALRRVCTARGLESVGIDAAESEEFAWDSADIRDPSIGDVIPEGAEALVHLAALSRDPDCRNRARECFDVNVMGSLNLIAAAKARGIKQFIFASSEWVYDRFEPGVEKTESAPIDATNLSSEYALSKLVSENNLRQQATHGFCPVTVLRFGIVYGPRHSNWSAVEALLNAVATTNEVAIGSAVTARRFIHVNDIAAGVLAAVGWDRAYDVFNIQGPSQVTLGEVIRSAGDIVGRHPRVRESDPEGPSIRSVSGRKASAELGWTARIGIREGLMDVAHYLGLASTEVLADSHES